MHYYPAVTLGPDKSFCAGVNVPLESSVSPYRNDYIYSWTPATPNLSNPDGPNTHFIADTTINYTLNVETPIGCSDSESILIMVFPSVNGGITPDTGYCPGGQLQLLATGGTSYNWTPSYGLSDTTTADPIADPETSTEYRVVITNGQNCVDTQKVSVQVYSNAVLNMADSVTVYPGERYQLEPGTNCYYFSWFPPSGISAIDISNPIFDPEVRTRYFVTATTEYGCSLRDSIDVLVNETIIDMPNAFMPTGANNLFRPSFRGMVTLKSFNIFNRWGNKVYTSTDINSGWDGSFNGHAQPMGVYVYIVEAVTDTGRIFTKKGNVTLIR
jgi:gliding motility-associated-like protein